MKVASFLAEADLEHEQGDVGMEAAGVPSREGGREGGDRQVPGGHQGRGDVTVHEVKPRGVDRGKEGVRGAPV